MAKEKGGFSTETLVPRIALSLLFYSSKKRVGSWLLAIDSICPFYWLDKIDGKMNVKAQLASNLAYLFSRQDVSCVVTKSLIWAAGALGQAPREYLGPKWANDLKKHRLVRSTNLITYAEATITV